jgi:hypothetical protein
MTTTTSIKMNRLTIASYFLAMLMAIAMISSCKKHDFPGKPSSMYSAEVLDKWITMQIRLMKNSTGIQNQALSRHYAYSGVAALEALAPGLPSHSKWTKKWNGLNGLPTPHYLKRYYYPANVNAAMAAINKAMFPNANPADKMAVDSLESALNASFLKIQPASVINRSNEFGKAVADAVYIWCETDGYKDANNDYTPPTGPGMWVPTAPQFAKPAAPYWGKNRTIVTGSLANAEAPAPLPYSEDIKSEFYQMVKHVYDAAKNASDDQKAAAIFWRDVPGVSSPGHWLSILQQLIRKTNTKLDKAAFAYALSGAAINDAVVSCWKNKYKYNLVRPVTYISNVMKDTAWKTNIGTPAHPEYSSGHAVLSSAAAATMEKIFGNVGSVTDHTYEYMGLPARTYPSIKAIGEEAAYSRVWAGIHYKQTAELGLIEGRQVATNILSQQNNFHLFSGLQEPSTQLED